MKQCAKGHFYDETRYEECPYCQQAAQSSGSTPGGVGKTVALQNQLVGKTIPLNEASSLPSSARGKTVGLIKSDTGIDPAVGFLVCVSGVHKGADFRLRSGRNFIGRTPDMDVSLPDDDTVSRENHSMVSYDSRNNLFTLVPGTGRGITYLNGNAVESATGLTAYDEISVGKSSLLFLPLCGEKFRWNN